MSAALIESPVREAVPMSYPASHRHPMNADGFARLLVRLHRDASQAAEEYEALRRALVRFFDWRGVSPPDDCADEVLDRLAHKLEETIVQDVKKYAHGIARLVALERRRGPVVSSIDEMLHVPAATAPPPADPDGDRLHDCLDRCLAGLPDDSRSLLLRYYEGDRKIDNRRGLASRLGLTDNALRSRVQRLRDRLEECVTACAATPVNHAV